MAVTVAASLRYHVLNQLTYSECLMATTESEILVNLVRPGQNSLNAALAKLKDLMGERYTESASVLETHGKGEAWHKPQLPDCVCFAESTEEVAAVVKICATHGIPVIPFGVGTSLEGQTLAPVGGVSIDLTGMNQILEVNDSDMDCRVQAGVTRKQLNTYLRDTGLFFPIDPGADATIGGMAATRASGTNAVRYGTMRENVMSLTFVNAKGEIVQTGTRARKSSSGYDLTRLMVGSEGTLGVITEIGLRLYGIPEATNAAVVNFPDLTSAVETVMDTIQMGMPISRIELIDTAYMQAINSYNKTTYPEADTLFLEFQGTEQSVAEQVQMFREFCDDHGGSDFNWAETEQERNKLWSVRHDAYWAILAKYPGKQGFTTDVCVPISRLAEIIGFIREEVDNSPLEAEILGHVGDGNFHMIFCVSPDDKDEITEVYRLNDALILMALEMGGTCTGEHGIGFGKLKYMRREHGDPAIAMMQSIKMALDPQNILNPGKTVCPQ